MLDLDLLGRLVAERQDDWAAAGIAWKLHRGAQTPKPAAWITCETAEGSAQLTVWVSGEAELEVGFLADGEIHAAHYDLDGEEQLRSCLDDLTRRLVETG